MKLRNLIILFFAISASVFASIPDSLINVLEHKNSTTIPGVNFTFNNNSKKNKFEDLTWLYFGYDKHNIMLNNQKDSGYQVIGRNFTIVIGGDENDDTFEFEKCQFNKVGWYKIYFRAGKENESKFYTLVASLIGAAEIYYDNRVVKTIGKIDLKDYNNGLYINNNGSFIPFYIADTAIHCISIRYAFPQHNELLEKYGNAVRSPDFNIYDGNETAYKSNVREIFFSITNMLSAFFFALFLIHLLIYLFYREKNFNLLYSLFLLLLSASFALAFILRFINDIGLYIRISYYDDLLFPLICFLLVTLLNKLLNEKPSWHYKGLVICLILLVIDLLFIQRYDGILRITIIMYTYFNTLAHSIKGIRRKVASAKFLGWGILSFTLSFVLLILSTNVFSLLSVKAAQSGPALYFYTFLLILSVLSIPLSMSAYLAYDFARTNSSLSLQLKQNQELNAKSLQQEKEKQEILANQNKMLETQVQERTKEIAEQNKLLEHQKKEITDSITYAKRIQQALLPDVEDIKKKLPNSFILYLPKDIVSGDFYFFQSLENNVQHPGREGLVNDNGIYFAAADCTGHGVPGALMSMIVHEKLEAATKIYDSPKDILKSINKQVKDALKQYQNEGSSRDGCDIAFLKITDKNISYSGAYRPLYYFAQDCSFHEIKATKTAIAGLTPYNQEFEQHELNPGNIRALYMFSDGFADQFGGEKIKKLTTKKFKELLSTIYTLPADDQKSRLESFFKSWKGNVEQIDDVLIIGVLF